jgi:hypothetical protein
MSASESPAPVGPTAQRPRPILLVLLGAAVVALLVYSMWPTASPKAAPSNQARDQRQAGGQTSPSALDVRLDALKQPPPEPADAARNPFRFYVKPPPPPAPRPLPPPALKPGDPGYQPPLPPPPPPIPPIPLKFIGTVEKGGRKWAIFSDGRGLPLYGKEGDLVLGQYKIVKIQVESVVMEYADGRGHQIIPMRGQ